MTGTKGMLVGSVEQHWEYNFVVFWGGGVVCGSKFDSDKSKNRMRIDCIGMVLYERSREFI